MNKKTAFFLITLLFLLRYTCYAKVGIDSCKIYNKIARKYLNCYYKAKQDSFLWKSLATTERSIKCNETRASAISIRVTCMILLRKYNSGLRLIEPLSDSNFKYPYQKIMYRNYIVALIAEEKSDSSTENSYLREIISNIADFMDTEKGQKGKIDKDAYYNIFFAEYKMKNIQDVCSDIDYLKVRFPSEIQFWDSLKSTLVSASKNKIPIIPPL